MIMVWVVSALSSASDVLRDKGLDGVEENESEFGRANETFEVWAVGFLREAVARFPLLWRAVYRAFAFHRAVALAHIFCLTRTSNISLSTKLVVPSSGDVCRRCPRAFISISFSRNRRCLLFLQNKHPMMKKHMKKARTRDSASMRVVRPPYTFSVGFHPAGNELRMMSWVGDTLGEASAPEETSIWSSRGG